MQFVIELPRFEIIQTIMFALNGIAISFILLISPSYGVCLEKLMYLHNDSDKILRQLHLPTDYCPVIMLAIFVQFFIYVFLSISTSFGCYEFLFENNNSKFIIFYEYIITIFIVSSFMFAIMQHAGNLLICLLRGWRINELIRKKIHSRDFDETDDDDDDDDTTITILYTSRSINTLFQLVIEFHNKQYAIAKTTLEFAAFANMIMAFVYSVNSAVTLYFYFYESYIFHNFFIAYVLCSIGFLFWITSGQLFKWQVFY